MERQLEKRADAIEERIDAKLAAMVARIDARIEKVETTLLAEFHKWASPAEARARTRRSASRHRPRKGSPYRSREEAGRSAFPTIACQARRGTAAGADGMIP